MRGHPLRAPQPQCPSSDRRIYNSPETQFSVEIDSTGGGGLMPLPDRLEDASNLTTDTGRFNRLTASADHRRRQSASAKTRMIQDQTPQPHAYLTWTCLLCRYRRIWTIAADRSDAALHPTTRTGECTVIRLASTPFQSVHMMGSPCPVRHA